MEDKLMIGNIKLAQIISKNEVREAKSVSSVAKSASDQASGDQYMASELAAVVKQQLESLQDEDKLDKILELRTLIQQGQYTVDADQLAEKILEELSA